MAAWNSGPEKKSVPFVLPFVQDIRMSIIKQNMSDRPAEEDSLVGVKALEDNSSDEYSKLSALPIPALVTLPAVDHLHTILLFNSNCLG